MYSRFIKSAMPFKPCCGFFGYMFACAKIPCAVMYRERYDITIDEDSISLESDLIAVGFTGSSIHSINEGTAIMSWLTAGRPWNPIKDTTKITGSNLYYGEFMHKQRG